ncbi:methyl-accepting chemotaxis protein [Paenibacillus paeoniae]|uniref:Methyl-accepting chemotaxis protein n=1 Tax=Paenibacillus paeoniae TaxID=2292705 RepID=A0A371P5E0_9BACL|nr:methyl-accepting chemotaxis protein [Paenibacillus paeoniae]REK71157.1 methyl-accepting chemotaxis protein [Paenibacillus paeoniae]
MKQPKEPAFRFTINRKLFAGFTAVLVVLMATVAIGYFQITQVDRHYTSIIEDKAHKLMLIQELNVEVKKEQAALRGYLLLGDPESLQGFTDAHNDYKALSRGLEAIIVHPEAAAMLQELDQLESEYYFTSNKSIKLKVSGDTKQYLEITSTQGQEILKKFDQKADTLIAYQQNLLDESKEEVHNEVQAIKQLVLLLGIAAVMIGLIVSWAVGRIISRPVISIASAAKQIAAGDLTSEKMIIRNRDEVGDLARSFNEMSEQLRSLIKHVHSSAEQVAASAQQLSATSEQASAASGQIAGTMQQVASDANDGFTHLEEASRTIHDMSAGVLHISAKTQHVSHSAFEAHDRAEEGSHAIHTATRQMGSIYEAVSGLSVQIDGLGERSTQIGHILNAITDMAKQTNILSLNAGIEAARAGENGKGFLVIASEIRKLAEESSHSAGQISELIASIQVETNQAVQKMGTASQEVASGLNAVRSAGTAFESIQHSVHAVNGQIQEVSSSIQQVAAGAEQIVGAMKAVTTASESTVRGAQEVSAATEEQLASMEEVSSSARMLSLMSEQLQGQLDKFKI